MHKYYKIKAVSVNNTSYPKYYCYMYININFYMYININFYKQTDIYSRNIQTNFLIVYRACLPRIMFFLCLLIQVYIFLISNPLKRLNLMPA